MRVARAIILAAILPTLVAETAEERHVRLRTEAAALLAPIEAAGGYAAIAERLAPWREAVARRIAAIPPAKHRQGYVADDAPLDAGDGLILSGRRAKQLIYESCPAGTDAVGDRRYARAEEMLLRTRDELATLGIRLIVVPAPDKCDVHPDRIAPVPDGVPTVHLKSRQMYCRLLHAGVEVVDPLAALAAVRDQDPPPCMLRDTHWSPRGSRLAAELVAQRLPEQRREAGGIIAREGQVLKHGGDLAENWKRSGRERPPEEEHRFVGVALENGKPVAPSATAPVLVLGDSYSTFPYNGYLAFWAHLSQLLGAPVGFADQAGGGNAVIDRFRRLPAKHRRHVEVVVLLFTNCAFYENDFVEPKLLDAPLPPPAMAGVRVTFTAAVPAIDAAAADYADADAHLPARVDRGDGVPVPMVIRVPVMRRRVLLPAATWPADQVHVLDLHPEPTPGDGGIMVLEVAEELAKLPLMHLRPSGP